MSHHYRLLDTNGDGTGEVNAVGNYLAEPEEFYTQPGPGRIAKIMRLMVYIEDSGSFDATKYGNNIDLVNGIELFFERNGELREDLMGGQPVMDNGGWAAQCYDAQVLTWGSGNEILTARWTFSASGIPIILNGDNADRLVIRLNDDFTGLVNHQFRAQGHGLPRTDATWNLPGAQPSNW